MALGTATNIRRDLHSYPRTVTADFPIASYTSGGETPTAANFKLRGFAPNQPITVARPRSTNGYIVHFDGTKIRAYQDAVGGITIGTTDGRTLASEEFGNALGGSQAAQITDSVSGAVNDERILALRAAADETVSSFAAQPDYPRNVVLTLEANGGAATLPTAGTVTVDGTFKGVAAQSVFDISATAGDFGTGTIAENNFRWAIGAEIFDTVTSVTVDVDGNEANLRYALGIGTKLGLELETDTEVEGTAIHRVLKNDTVVTAATYVFDGTNNGVDLGADIADNDEVRIEYFVDSDTASGAATGNLLNTTEATAATNVGTVTLTAHGFP